MLGENPDTGEAASPDLETKSAATTSPIDRLVRNPANPRKVFTEAEIANSVFVRFLNVPTAAGSGGTDVAGTAAVPEPAAGCLFALALAGVFRSARKRMAVRQ